MGKITLKINSDKDILSGALLLADNLNVEFGESGIVIDAVSGDNFKIDKSDGKYIVTYSLKAEFYRALAIIVDSVRRGEFESISSIRNFETCGVMLDMSRNSVYTVETLKEYLRYMALMGLNMLMLYTEDTYEITEYPMFGFGRGRYTKDEIREIDSYAASLGIELIPCIQTLSHLETALGWGYTANFKNTSRTLYVGKEETYEFIENMFKSVKECFSSKRIHIGLDEASDIGIGKILKEKGYTPPFELMKDHVNRVCNIAEKYDFKPMMWSDMFFKNGTLGGDYDYTSIIPDGASGMLSDDIELVYWDYCYSDYVTTDKFLERHRNELGKKTIFAGGIWTWNRLCPSFVKTFDTANSQLKACKQNGVTDVFVTVWGSFCSEFDFSILPGIQMYAEHMYNNEVSEKQLSHMFEVCTGYKLSDFMLLGLDEFDEKTIKEYGEPGAFCINSSAQHFFNDILFGLYDKTLSGYDFKSHYKKCLKKFSALGDMGKFNDLFYQTELLAKILVIKSSIGPDITEAYKSNDFRRLSKYCSVLKELLSLYEEYHEMTAKRWHAINKPFGFEGKDMYLGCVEARVKNAIRRLTDYINGDIERIEELELERVYYNGQENPLTESNAFSKIMTVGSFI